jgi:hypothetical protein
VGGDVGEHERAISNLTTKGSSIGPRKPYEEANACNEIRPVLDFQKTTRLPVRIATNKASNATHTHGSEELNLLNHLVKGSRRL